METKQFSYLDSKGLSHEVTLSAKDFEFVQRDAIITDQKIQSKPTTFFKDAIRRFRKNKSSVAGGVILGILIALAIVLPLALPSDVDNPHPSETYLAPKLFDAGTGWWDGGLDYNNVVIDVDWEAYDRDGTIVGKPTDHDISMVIGGADGIRYHGVEYTNAINNYAHGGYVRINGSSAAENMPELHSWNGLSYDFTDDSKNYAISLNAVDPRTNGLSSFWEFGAVVGYDVRLQWYTDPSHATKLSYTLAENVTDFGETVINLNDHLDGIKAVIDSDPASAGFYTLEATFNSPEFVISLASTDATQAVSNVVFKSIIFSSDDEAEAEALKSLSIYDANQALSIPPKDSQGKDNPYHWSTLNGNVNLFHSAIARASYRIDTYKEKYGLLYGTVDLTDLRTWADKGWVSADFDMIADLSGYNTDTIKILGAQFAQTIKVLDTTYSPLVIDEEHAIVGSGGGTSRYLSVTVSGHVWQWKKLYPGTTSMPRYLFGTDISGRDMLKYVFAGLRTSLLLGVITFLVNFSFGLVYGAIAGYFGGWTDIIMERITDILGGVPWIVVMTLMIVLFGHTFTVFAIALCITGWIGTSSLTRTQFYRFKSREYILAARTLGASDGRLIFRHILPNAVGTIVTSSVLMIPGVIFSEATLAYLNLGMQGMNSFGVILSDNQSQINTNPHLILFPSAIMALMMISFNLFGNGLRDAFNPSLKGGE